MDPNEPIPPHPPLSHYYSAPADREKFVRKIFDEGAAWYDWIGAFSSFGSGNRYRRGALVRAGLKPGMRALDVATGTGVLARAAVGIMGGKGVVIGLDPSIGMLLAGAGTRRGAVVQAVGESLPFPPEAFDFLSIGFALRHLSDLRTAFAEYRRVLRPGGRLAILEITPPENRMIRPVLGLYMGRIVPAITRLRTGSAEAETMMKYYWETTAFCVSPATILEALRDAGFQNPIRTKAMGIFSEYTGGR